MLCRRIISFTILSLSTMVVPGPIHAQALEKIVYRPRPQLSFWGGSYGYFPTTWRPWPGTMVPGAVSGDSGTMLLSPNSSPSFSLISKPTTIEQRPLPSYPKAPWNPFAQSNAPSLPSSTSDASWQRHTLPNTIYPPAHIVPAHETDTGSKPASLRVHLPPDPTTDLDLGKKRHPSDNTGEVILPSPLPPSTSPDTPLPTRQRIIRIHDPDEAR